jgi:hypothetical protein
MSRLTFFTLLFVGLLFTGCSKKLSEEESDMGNVSLSFSSVVKNQPLLSGQDYTNEWGEKYSVTTFKYYLHDLVFVNAAGVSYPASDAYYLVDEAKPETKIITLRLPSGEYNRVIYTLGVDSARNVSGAQTGVLDPTNGMFWTWSSGYVMAKLEGASPSAATANGNFSYHVGGFKQSELAIKRIQLNVPAGNSLKIAKGTSVMVDIQADINTWFGSAHPIKIAENPACHSPGALAKQIADNYAGMFSISGIR